MDQSYDKWFELLGANINKNSSESSIVSPVLPPAPSEETPIIRNTRPAGSHKIRSADRHHPRPAQKVNFEEHSTVSFVTPNIQPSFNSYSDLNLTDQWTLFPKADDMTFSPQLVNALPIQISQEQIEVPIKFPIDSVMSQPSRKRRVHQPIAKPPTPKQSTPEPPAAEPPAPEQPAPEPPAPETKSLPNTPPIVNISIPEPVAVMPAQSVAPIPLPVLAPIRVIAPTIKSAPIMKPVLPSLPVVSGLPKQPTIIKSNFQSELDSQMNSMLKLAIQHYQSKVSEPVPLETPSQFNLRKDRYQSSDVKPRNSNDSKNKGKPASKRAQTPTPNKRQSSSKSKKTSKLRASSDKKDSRRSQKKLSRKDEDAKDENRRRSSSQKKSDAKAEKERKKMDAKSAKAEKKKKSHKKDLLVDVGTKKPKFAISRPLNLTDQIDDQLIYLGQVPRGSTQTPALPPKKNQITKLLRVKVLIGTLKKIVEEMDLLLTLSLGQVHKQKMVSLTKQSLKVISEILSVMTTPQDVAGLPGLIDLYGRLDQALKSSGEILNFEIGYYLTQLLDSLNRITVNLSVITKSNIKLID